MSEVAATREEDEPPQQLLMSPVSMTTGSLGLLLFPSDWWLMGNVVFDQGTEGRENVCEDNPRLTEVQLLD